MTREEAISMTREDAANLLDILRVFDAPGLTQAIKMAKDALREQPHWISVEERLPEDDACYLVCVSGRHENITFDRALEVAEYVSGCGWFLEGWPEWVKPGITHWMPLPEPPKEEV